MTISASPSNPRRQRTLLLQLQLQQLKLRMVNVTILVVVLVMMMQTTTASAFVIVSSRHFTTTTTTSLYRATTTKSRCLSMMMEDPSLATTATAFAAAPDDTMMNTATAAVTAMLSSSIQLAETDAWVQPLSFVLDPVLNFLSFAMLARVVLSWYPNIKKTDFPYAIIVYPTEPLLRVAKGFIPPAFGVDITPVFWLAICTFIHEILLGQQGLLTMKMKYGI